MPEYIFDTTVLSNFAGVDCLKLLEMRYSGIANITLEIEAELRKGVEAGYDYLESVLQQIKKGKSAGWLNLLIPRSLHEYRLRLSFDRSLDAGESSCLALAVSRSLILATDDLAARRLAKKEKVRLTGTLGILIALVRSETVSLAKANAMLASMIVQGYRSPVTRLDALI